VNETNVPGSLGDYAASIGTTGLDFDYPGPNGTRIVPNGAFRFGLGVRFAEITDGLSNTLLVGDKHVPSFALRQYPWDCSIYDGHNLPCATRPAGPGFPLATTRFDQGWVFGSNHPHKCQFVFADGSVHTLSTNISPVTLGLLASKDDGQVIPDY
jgi:prepilin-type processing-associated H-X9-DG protein